MAKYMVVVVAVLVLAGVATGEWLGSEFTYQGVLADGGSPVSGSFDFRFVLYDAEAGGGQVGPIVYVDDLAVSDGRVSTQLDFGWVFDGTAFWLEVAVRDGGSTGAYTVLSPRQELTASPNAQYSTLAYYAATAGSASNADHATIADSADQLAGQNPGYYLQWDNLIGIPGDISDGDQDTLDDLACSSDEIAKWNGSAWACAGDVGVAYARTYVVGPVGTPAENGAALVAALAAVPAPSTAEEAALLKIEPGIYQLPGFLDGLKPWVDVEGSGVGTTRIRAAVCSIEGEWAVITNSASDVEIRHLTVENTCGLWNRESAVVTNSGDLVSLTDVKLVAAGPTYQNTGVRNTGAALTLDHVSVVVTGADTTATAIYNEGPDLVVTDSSLVVQSPVGATGIESLGDYMVVRRVTISTALGAASVGIETDDVSAEIRDVVLDGYTGVLLIGRSGTRTVTLTGVTVVASYQGLFTNEVSGTLIAYVDHCKIEGATYAIQGGNGEIWIGASQLAVGSVSGAGVTCAGVYDGSYTFYAGCP